MIYHAYAALGVIDALRCVDDGATPPVSAGEVRLRVEAAALGYVDSLIVAGKYQIKPSLPYIPGGEFAGTIDAVGPEVTDYVVGDRVAAWRLGGGFAQYVVLPASDLARLPAGLSSVHAAAMLVDYQTAYYALFHRGQVRAGETVLVAGASGGVGSAAVQLAVACGAFVIAAGSTAEKRERARLLGAHAAIDPGASDLREAIRTAAPEGGVDVVVDPVGGETFEQYFRSLRKEGRHLVIGFAGGRIPALPANLALLKSASLIGVDLRQFLAAHPEDASAARDELFANVASGRLLAPALQTFPFDRALHAVRAAGARGKLGKVVVLPRQDDLPASPGGRS
jgi:NADPH2:quinone reductase